MMGDTFVPSTADAALVNRMIPYAAMMMNECNVMIAISMHATASRFTERC